MSRLSLLVFHLSVRSFVDILNFVSILVSLFFSSFWSFFCQSSRFCFSSSMWFYVVSQKKSFLLILFNWTPAGRSKPCENVSNIDMSDWVRAARISISFLSGLIMLLPACFITFREDLGFTTTGGGCDWYSVAVTNVLFIMLCSSYCSPRSKMFLGIRSRTRWARTAGVEETIFL